MSFFQFLYLIVWGAMCGWLSINLLSYLLCVLSGYAVLKNHKLSLALGLLTSPAIYSITFTAILCAGFYLGSEVLEIRHFENKPLFIIFCLVGLAWGSFKAYHRHNLWLCSLKSL